MRKPEPNCKYQISNRSLENLFNPNKNPTNSLSFRNLPLFKLKYHAYRIHFSLVPGARKRFKIRFSEPSTLVENQEEVACKTFK